MTDPIALGDFNANTFAFRGQGRFSMLRIRGPSTDAQGNPTGDIHILMDASVPNNIKFEILGPLGGKVIVETADIGTEVIRPRWTGICVGGVEKFAKVMRGEDHDSIPT